MENPNLDHLPKDLILALAITHKEITELFLKYDINPQDNYDIAALFRAKKCDFDCLPTELIVLILDYTIGSIINKENSANGALRACNDFLRNFKRLSKHYHKIVHANNEMLFKSHLKKIAAKISLESPISKSIVGAVYYKIKAKLDEIKQQLSRNSSIEEISNATNLLNEEIDIILKLNLSEFNLLETEVKRLFRYNSNSGKVVTLKNKLNPYIQEEFKKKIISYCLLVYLLNNFNHKSDQEIEIGKALTKILISTDECYLNTNFINTALIKASEHGNRELVKLLLEYGANVNAQNNDGQTALMLAASQGHEEVVELLLELEYGIDVYAQDNKDQTALSLVERPFKTQSQNKIADFLRSKMELCNTCSKALRDKKVTLKCGHKFHEGCILEWFDKHSVCPNCKNPCITDIPPVDTAISGSHSSIAAAAAAAAGNPTFGNGRVGARRIIRGRR